MYNMMDNVVCYMWKLLREQNLRGLIRNLFFSIWYLYEMKWGALRWHSGKNPPVSAGDTKDASLIPGSGRFPREGNDNPLQYSCIENSMVRGIHWVTKSWTWLSIHFSLNLFDEYYMLYLSQVIMLYIINLYSAVCQLYLNKIGRKKLNVITERCL